MLKRKSKPLKVHFINGTHLERLYNQYLHQTIFDRVLDNLVFLAIIFTISNFISHHLFHIESVVLNFINSISYVILLIFGLDLLRNYLKSDIKKHFFSHNGLDVFLIVFLSFYFLFFTYLEILRFRIFSTLKPWVLEIKHIRVIMHLFRR